MNLKLENNIIRCLPYKKPFIFVNGLEGVNSNSIEGYCIFNKENPMLQGHFKDNPVVPGVLLLEAMGQIGIVCHFIYLSEIYKINKLFYPIIANIEMDFLKTANTDEKLIVSGEKVYFRNNLLKSKVNVRNLKGEVLARSLLITKFKYKPE